MIAMLMIHSAERTRSRSEQREADDMTSELAAALGRLGSFLPIAWRGRRRLATAPPG